MDGTEDHYIKWNKTSKTVIFLRFDSYVESESTDSEELQNGVVAAQNL